MGAAPAAVCFLLPFLLPALLSAIESAAPVSSSAVVPAAVPAWASAVVACASTAGFPAIAGAAAKADALAAPPRRLCRRIRPHAATTGCISAASAAAAPAGSCCAVLSAASVCSADAAAGAAAISAAVPAAVHAAAAAVTAAPAEGAAETRALRGPSHLRPLGLQLLEIAGRLGAALPAASAFPAAAVAALQRRPSVLAAAAGVAPLSRRGHVRFGCTRAICAITALDAGNSCHGTVLLEMCTCPMWRAAEMQVVSETGAVIRNARLCDFPASHFTCEACSNVARTVSCLLLRQAGSQVAQRTPPLRHHLRQARRSVKPMPY